MIDLKDINQVKGLQANLRASLNTPPGKEVVSFLEEICGWYDFNETNPNIILIKDGKRQVLAMLKTLLDHPAEVIVALAQQKEM